MARKVKKTNRTARKPVKRSGTSTKAMRSRAAAKGAATRALKENRRAVRTAATAAVKTANDTVTTLRRNATKRAKKVQADAGDVVTGARRTMASRQAARRRARIEAMGKAPSKKVMREPVPTIAENKKMGAPIRERIEKRAQAMMAEARRQSPSAGRLFERARKTVRKAADIAVGVGEAMIDTVMP